MARLILALLLVIAPRVVAQESDSFTTNTLDGYSMLDFMSTFGAYPIPFELTEQDREAFHAVAYS